VQPQPMMRHPAAERLRPAAQSAWTTGRVTVRAMKIVYKPFGLLFGILAGLVSRKVFNVVWAQIDEEQPPNATTDEAPVGKVLAAAALQGLVFSTTRAAVDRYGAEGFRYLTGIWPGDTRQEPLDD
jgi:hypothetical protein